MILAICVILYLLYKGYRIEKQKSYDFERRVNWPKIINKWVIILGIIFLTVGILKYYKVVDYINSDTAQIKKVRTALSGKWLLVKRHGFKDAKIEPNSILTIQTYFRRFPGHFFPEVYNVKILKPKGSKLIQEIFLQNPNEVEFGLYASTKILKLNNDTLILNYPPFINSTEKGTIASYRRLE